MTTIESIEKQIEEARQELNEAIAEYEDAISNPDYYDVELANEMKTEALNRYNELQEELEAEKAWLAF